MTNIKTGRRTNLLGWVFIIFLAIFVGYIFLIFGIEYVFAVNTESLVAEVATRQEIVYTERGQYEYIAPVCDPQGCYIANHIEKWCGQATPCGVGYQVIYTKTDGLTKADATTGFNDLIWDWTIASIAVNTSTL